MLGWVTKVNHMSNNSSSSTVQNILVVKSKTYWSPLLPTVKTQEQGADGYSDQFSFSDRCHNQIYMIKVTVLHIMLC